MLKLFLAPFKILFKILGVNYNQLHAILKVKLAMDNRRSFSFSNKKSSNSNQLIKQSLSYAILGTILVFTLITLKSTLLGYTIFFTFIMAMITVAMISEFTTILFDTRDNSILFSRPINSKTLATAKIFHIAIYMLQISLSLALATLIYTLYKFGILATLTLFALLILTAFFTLFITNIFYFTLSNLVSSQRIKDIVVYFQVVMAILFMGAYQLMPRIMDYYDMKNIGTMTLKWWHLLVPSTWMSSTLDIVIHNNYDLKHIVFLIATVAAPTLSIMLVIKVLSPRFNKAIQQDEKQDKVRVAKKTKSTKQNWIGSIANFVTSTQQEATCFKMIWKMSSRERKYKQTVYPVFGYLIIFIAMYTFKGKDFSLETLRESKRYLIFLYFPILLSYSLIANLCFSENRKESWFYRAAPISSPGTILRGALKAVFIKYFIPTYTIITTVCVLIWGPTIIGDILLALILNLLTVTLMQRTQVNDLPFTIEKTANDIGHNLVQGLLLMIFIGITWVIHFGLTYINYAVLIAIVPFAIVVFVLLKSYNKISWSKIYS